MLCRNEFSSRLQKRRLFLCFRMLLRFWYATVCILMCEEHHLYCVFQGGISGLRYSRYRNGFRWLHQRVCKRSGSWTSAEIFQNNVCGSAVLCCPASSALQITPRQSSTRRLRASHFAVPSVFARLRHRLAEAKSRLCRDEDWWAMTDSNRRHSRCKRDALTNWANRPFLM